MDKEIICIDTSLFIDYFRKQKKERTILAILSDEYDFCISVITLNLKDFSRVPDLKILNYKIT